ncbi:patatin-domain-containing protein, partial [Rhodotorula sp. JG-1b]
TLSLPSLAFSALHYSASLTFHLTFLKIVAFLLIVTTIASYVWKVRYLNRYTELRDLPGGNRIKGDVGFDLDPDLANDQTASGFHNYLDEFLSAIKVFGYLEKPVFHELARHLQTRRLVAGDTLDLSQDKSFYIVVDGRVEVFARTPQAATNGADDYGSDTDPSDDDAEGKGWQLLNNVESGGTLSSLFTILRLFTEDVKLRYEEDKDAAEESSASDDGGAAAAFAKQHRERDADVSTFELDGGAIHAARRAARPNLASRDFGSLNTAALNDTDDADVEDAARADDTETTLASPYEDTEAENETLHDRGQLDHLDSTIAPQSTGPQTIAGESTIARAATDTTLAVIPAEAFRRLTKKFPNAAAHIVQVILTRLQRVTFLTAHKYLGLTREVVRTEKAINDLACYPLPPAFWESGGIQRLRARFVPETKLDGPYEHDAAVLAARRYNVPLMTPYAGPKMGEVFWDEVNVEHSSDDGVRLKYRAPNSSLLGSPASRRPLRKAGDLLTMSSVAPSQGMLPVQTPRLERTKTDRTDDGGERDFDLREAVMECISKAIGLVQPHVTPSQSAEASPALRPHERQTSANGTLRDQAAFNSSFGSLSMLGLSGLNDDESSISSLSSLRNADAGAVGSFTSMDLENEVEILYFPQGSVLVKEGERNAGLYFVIDGFLDVSMPETQPATGPKVTRKQTPVGSDGTASPASPSKAKSIHLFTVRPGGIAGYLSSLSGFPSYVDITAKTECYVGFLPAKALERIMDRKPIVLLTLAKRLISLLSPLVLHIDSALDWMHVSAGQVIYRQNDSADSFYIVINGRLRSITDRQEGGIQVQAEHGQGESVGELDCITSTPRPTTLHAIRDTELARMPMTLFNAISVRHPLVTIQISRIIAARLRLQVTRESKLQGGLPKELGAPGMGDNGMGKNNFNLKTVAVIPTNRHVPVSEFASKLHAALEGIGAPTSYLNQATVMQVLGRHAFSKMGQLKLAGWLAETEQKYRIVLYVADTAISAPWTQTCIRQADCILVVADAGAEPDLGEHEKLLVSMKTTARKELVLLHAERNVISGSTRPWLRNRPWVHAHHHVEMLGATPEVNRSQVHNPTAVVALQKLAARFELEISKYKKAAPRPVPQRAPAFSDFARLARRLCGKSIGIVLGGGGARGISHVGVLRALHDRGIPIDMVGGTSIGAFVGGLYAKEGDLVSMYGRAKRFSGRMSTLWRILTDLTYPVVAYTTGHEFNRGIYKSFYDTHIEDMWLPYFCNTTNITHSRMDVHTSGYAWRYVRASMSLAGLLPPLCDEGDMLVDGGYVDNLPVSVMLGQGAASVFAIDVGSVDDTSPRNYGESVSGWYLLLQRWNPFGKQPNIPNITEIQSRLTYVSSVKMLEEAKATPGVLYMRMPVTQFGTMEFKRFTEILDVGSEFANSLLDEWAADKKLPTGMEGDAVAPRKQKRGQPIRRNSI